MQKYRVLLVEDRAIHRLYFENVIHNSSRYTLIGTEVAMAEAVKRCEHSRIDLILMEAADKEGNLNFAAAEYCKKHHSYVRIVVMTSSPEHTFPQRAKECGADSFWYTDNTKESVLSVMDRTMEGESIWPEERPSVKIGEMDSRKFTEKELHILGEVAKGYSNKEIAETLQMSYYTVRDYVKSLLEKTHLQSQTELAVKAVSSGLIILENNISKSVR